MADSNIPTEFLHTSDPEKLETIFGRDIETVDLPENSQGEALDLHAKVKHLGFMSVSGTRDAWNPSLDAYDF